MVAHIKTVAFQGIDAIDVDVQVQTSGGMPVFSIVGLPDKAIAESRDRVRGALHAMGLALPQKRITVNLSPADLAKEGSHYDLPIALGLLVAMGVLPADELAAYTALGELTLDGSLVAATGVLPAAVHSNAQDRGLICPAAQGGEAAWAGNRDILAADCLLSLVNHFNGTQVLSPPKRPVDLAATEKPDLAGDLADVRGQETAKRALEIAAAGGHNLLMVGPPGAGKSMLAQRLPGLLPPLEPTEMLEVSMVHSLAGLLADGRISSRRPFRTPHHSASMAALVGGGQRARPGEISLAHLGVLFLDELPEFPRNAIEALRQPLETGVVDLARANAHVRYPARVQLVAAMNPCRCGHLAEAGRACSRALGCADTYVGRLSGPLLDRFDMRIEVPAVRIADLSLPAASETTEIVAGRVAQARRLQGQRFIEASTIGSGRTNAQMSGDALEAFAAPDAQGRQLLLAACERLGLSARGYHRVLRVARTIADLDASAEVRRPHLAEALAYRQAVGGVRRGAPTPALRRVS